MKSPRDPRKSCRRPAPCWTLEGPTPDSPRRTATGGARAPQSGQGLPPAAVGHDRGPCGPARRPLPAAAPFLFLWQISNTFSQKHHAPTLRDGNTCGSDPTRAAPGARPHGRCASNVPPRSRGPRFNGNLGGKGPEPRGTQRPPATTPGTRAAVPAAVPLAWAGPGLSGAAAPVGARPGCHTVGGSRPHAVSLLRPRLPSGCHSPRRTCSSSEASAPHKRTCPRPRPQVPAPVRPRHSPAAPRLAGSAAAPARLRGTSGDALGAGRTVYPAAREAAARALPVTL